MFLFFDDVKIDAKFGSEGVIESEQSLVIPELCVPSCKWRLFHALPLQSAYECRLLLSSTFDAGLLVPSGLCTCAHAVC